ncbi:MAG: hypothetical protein DCC75_03180 [Proteobacteria bacterium]|nr:MAG: hypothetical protein DCC75_03180 [Pseudomonadota bacterium]
MIGAALPLDAINAASVREGYIYRDNPSALHKWWAQRPLAAARAALAFGPAEKYRTAIKSRKVVLAVSIMPVAIARRFS